MSTLDVPTGPCDELVATLRSIRIDLDYAIGQLRRDRPDPMRALDALERIQEAVNALPLDE